MGLVLLDPIGFLFFMRGVWAGAAGAPFCRFCVEVLPDGQRFL